MFSKSKSNLFWICNFFAMAFLSSLSPAAEPYFVYPLNIASLVALIISFGASKSGSPALKLHDIRMK